MCVCGWVGYEELNEDKGSVCVRKRDKGFVFSVNNSYS